MTPAQAPSPPKRRGLMGAVAAILGSLLLAALASMALEWGGMLLVWPEQGAQHSRDMLNDHIEYLNRDFRETVAGFSPVAFTGQTLQAIQQSSWASSIKDWAQKMADLSSQALGGQPWFSAIGVTLQTVVSLVDAALNTLCVFVIRLIILALAAPRLVLYVMLAFLYGFVKHEIRKFGGGRELGFRYHHIKRWLLPSLALAVIAYLSVPESIHPNWFLLPMTAFFSAAVLFWIATFKLNL